MNCVHLPTALRLEGTRWYKGNRLLLACCLGCGMRLGSCLTFRHSNMGLPTPLSPGWRVGESSYAWVYGTQTFSLPLQAYAQFLPQVWTLMFQRLSGSKTPKVRATPRCCYGPWPLPHAHQRPLGPLGHAAPLLLTPYRYPPGRPRTCHAAL